MKNAYDIVVVGSGIAGLSFALKAAAAGRSVAILTKKTSADSNTNFAQGGLAAVMAAEDNFDNHVRDTLVAGDGLCNEAAVRAIVSDAPARVRELVEIGLEFSREPNGQFELGREGGHSHRRILHVKDMTGKAIEEALLRAVAKSGRIDLFEHLFAIDVVTSAKVAGAVGPNRVLGLHALDVIEHHVVSIAAPVVMLATGGAGQVYLYTTNPTIATGDGIAMAYRAGVPVRNMEFIQFHPTTLYTAGGPGTTFGGRRFLISEAVRGEGAILRNFAGEAFMPRYHHQADLAPRDIVARAIDAEMKASGTPHVWLDIRHKDEAWLRQRFPQIFEGCEKVGLNMAKDLLPVVPAAHYTCGGVATDLAGATELPGLYACGEVGCTGLHGANRLASNSLLEAIVVAHRASLAVEKYFGARARRRRGDPRVEGPRRRRCRRTRRAHPQLGGAASRDVGLRGHRAHDQAAGARARPPDQPRQGDPRLLLALLCRPAAARAAQLDHDRRADRGLRAAAPREPRAALHAGFPAETGRAARQRDAAELRGPLFGSGATGLKTVACAA
jgi:L-aspartate oxidase